jgi:tetratricopeptide (TPR) repeat protein
MSRNLLTLIALALVFGFLAVRSVRRSEDPSRTVFKWVLTLLTACFLRWYVWPMTGQGGMVTFISIAYTIVCGLVLFVTWYREVGSFISQPLTSLFDGGNLEPEPRPLYSRAQAKQKKGLYLEAITDIRQQLDRFPTDFEGHMLLAQIQVEDLKDLPGAELTIQRLCSQPGHAPANIAFALYSLADWHLKYGADRDAARRAFEQVIALLPDTEFALTAAQRIAHLGSPEMMLPATERRKFTVAEGVRHFGLLKESQPIKPVEKDPAQSALDYVKHLEKHPLDTDAREQLAVIYADHYQRLDLAADQLEQMIAQPTRPLKLVAHWLNLLADLQLRSGADYDTIKQTLQRIIDLDPKHSAGETARKRIDILKLELKGKQQNQSVKMGSYEQNLGLKRGGISLKR